MWTTVWVVFGSFLCFILGIAAYAFDIQIQKADDEKAEKERISQYYTYKLLNQIEKHISVHNLIQFTNICLDSSLQISRQKIYLEDGSNFSLYKTYIDDEPVVIVPDSLELNKNCEKIYESYLAYKSEICV